MAVYIYINCAGFIYFLNKEISDEQAKEKENGIKIGVSLLAWRACAERGSRFVQDDAQHFIFTNVNAKSTRQHGKWTSQWLK